MTKCGGSCCGSPPLPCTPRARSRAASPVLGFRLSSSLSAALSLSASCLKNVPVFSASVRFYLDYHKAKMRGAAPLGHWLLQSVQRKPNIKTGSQKFMQRAGGKSTIRKRWHAPEATKPPRAPACHKPAPIAIASRTAPNAGIRGARPAALAYPLTRRPSITSRARSLTART